MTAFIDSLMRPRVVSLETGDAVLLEDEAEEWLHTADRGAFEIVGPSGSGKTTALVWLAAAFQNHSSLRFLDEPSLSETLAAGLQGRLIYARRESLPGSEVSRRLAPWTDDELLEYALAAHRPTCASIMARVRAMPDRGRLRGLPQLWRAVLAALARDEHHNDFREILVGVVAEHLRPETAALAMRYCLAVLLQAEGAAAACAAELVHLPAWPELQRWLRHSFIQTLLTAWQFPLSLEQRNDLHFLSHRWPRELLGETGRRLTSSAKARENLERVVSGRAKVFHSTAASLLHAADCGWRPAGRTRPRLTGAVLCGAVWLDIALSGHELCGVDLARADLRGASFKQVQAQRAVLRNANLAGANLEQAKLDDACAAGAKLDDSHAAQSSWRGANFQYAHLRRADFRNAELSKADFSHAVLAGARLIGARLNGALLRGADLSHADLTNARLRKVRLVTAILERVCLRGADLTEAELEFLELADADLEGANFTRADLTGSCLSRARMCDANLHQAGLADVHWEGADLRNADFTHASFHLGSSRSGLVGSPLACEGSRTGFYTDDFDEQGFKSPEEIRKANLRSADLRGAIVDGADFYLVDLRDALYDDEQARHFIRCRAILFDSNCQ